NYPNPFNPETTIRFSIPAGIGSSSVELSIYNALGQLVRTLVNQPLQPGVYKSIWDGRDDRGHSVASGIYVYRLSGDAFNTTRKMILMK
ncbi:MAG: FlgD immunoglobulin-like domain containing protein, partial [Calditrichota bacterium]